MRLGGEAGCRADTQVRVARVHRSTAERKEAGTTAILQATCTAVMLQVMCNQAEVRSALDDSSMQI